MKKYSEFVKIATKLGLKILNEKAEGLCYATGTWDARIVAVEINVDVNHSCRTCRSYIKRWSGAKPQSGFGQVILVTQRYGWSTYEHLELCSYAFKNATANAAAKAKVHKKNRKKVIQVAGKTFIKAPLLEPDDPHRWDIGD